ncbi:MAG: hypothetical protein ACTSUE_26370 [Promethearchaeota archaeon]
MNTTQNRWSFIVADTTCDAKIKKSVFERLQSVHLPMSPNCIVLMWTSAHDFPQTLKLCTGWGLRYVGVELFWVKMNKTNDNPCFNPGHYTASNIEMLLMFVHGFLNSKCTNSGAVYALTKVEKYSRPLVTFQFCRNFGIRNSLDTPLLLTLSGYEVGGFDYAPFDLYRDFTSKIQTSNKGRIHSLSAWSASQTKQSQSSSIIPSVFQTRALFEFDSPVPLQVVMVKYSSKMNLKQLFKISFEHFMSPNSIIVVECFSKDLADLLDIMARKKHAFASILFFGYDSKNDNYAKRGILYVGFKTSPQTKINTLRHEMVSQIADRNGDANNDVYTIVLENLNRMFGGSSRYNLGLVEYLPRSYSFSFSLVHPECEWVRVERPVQKRKRKTKQKTKTTRIKTK